MTWHARCNSCPDPLFLHRRVDSEDFVVLKGYQSRSPYGKGELGPANNGSGFSSSHDSSGGEVARVVMREWEGM